MFKEDDHVRLKYLCRLPDGRSVPIGRTGIVGKMRTETGFVFVEFSCGTCLLVEELALEAA